MTLTEKTTVEVLEDGDLIIVGEEHTGEGATRSRELGEEILNEYQPQTVAIEAPPGRATGGRGAMSLANGYARRNGADLLTIDNQRGPMRRAVDNFSDYLGTANTFTYPIQEDGDLNPKAIENARQLVYELYGEEAYYEMYTHREEKMAARLREAAASFQPPIVLFCGAFHVPALVEQYHEVDYSLPLEGKRVTTFVSDPGRATA